VWVSDSNDPETGFFGPLSGQTDSGLVDLLQGAGHNVIRYNPPAAQATLLTDAEIAALNTNDLVIISRCVNSAIFQTGQGNQWNTSITKPLLDLSAFHARNSRLGWFAGNEGADNTPTVLTPANESDPVTDYLFSDAVMNGTNSALPYDEAIDRNSTPIPSDPVAGGTVYARGTYVQENNAANPPTITTANFVVGFPAGTVVRGGVDVSGGYRMFFAAGSRESATAPNAIPAYTSRENLSPMGEKVFLRAVEVAINNGVAPSTHSGPLVQTLVPTNTTVAQGASVTFSAAVQGGAPRLVWWTRNDGTGFTNIPGTFTAFERTAYMLTNVSPADNGAQFGIMYSNALAISINPAFATLTVTPDTAVPTPVSAASLDGSVVSVCFNELINTNTMTADPSAYAINGGSTILVTSATAGSDGKSVNLILSEPIGATATVDFFYLEDVFGNVAFSGPTITATNLGLTGVDVGAVSPAGSQFACDANSFQVSAGGLDIGSTADILHFVYKMVTGDFDARVRVSSFVGMTNDHFETTAKAMLLARVNDTAGSADVKTWVTPPPPGDNLASASYRPASGGATNSFGPSVQPSAIPNAWLRLQRVADQYTTYSSTNGTDWITIGTASVPLGNDLHVGVGVVSHRNGKSATATFSDFKISQGNVPVATLLLRPTYSAGQFSASFQTQSGSSYIVEYKNDLNTAGWTTVITIPGDGTVKSFTDPGPVSPTGNRFYRITVQ
jgi:hypothetical protein